MPTLHHDQMMAVRDQRRALRLRLLPEPLLRGRRPTRWAAARIGRRAVATAGGIGRRGSFDWLVRLCGLACDNLLTADYRAQAARAGAPPTLFWGLRGGGGDFGVVTSFADRPREVGPTSR